MRALPPDPDLLAGALGHRRVLLAGPSGSGKSTLLGPLCDRIGASALTADPGRPVFGPPGAVHLASRSEGAWRVLRTEGLGTLDAVRLRLPLVVAVGRLVADAGEGALLIDAPGVHRGAVAAELIRALVEIGRAEVLAWLGEELPAWAGALPVEPVLVRPPPDARPLPSAERLAVRTAAWDAWLEGALEVEVPELPVIGTPPPREDWTGRQVVVTGPTGRTLTLGEVVRASPRLVLRAPPFDVGAAAGILVGDARRIDGSFRTADRPRPPARALGAPLPLPRTEAATALHAVLLGGLLGDATLHLRFAEASRSLLLDLGEHPDLSVHLAHQVTHLCVTHAHMDHFNGFPWLVRRRIGQQGVVTVLGPPEIARRVQGFVDGITWDRIGETGPRFRVGEVREGRLCWYAVQAGRGCRALGEEDLTDDVVHREEAFVLRATLLDHGIPVVAWAVEEPRRASIRTDALAESGHPPGPWVGELVRSLAAGEQEAAIRLPDGSARAAGELGAELAEVRPGRRLVYATDFGDLPRNRERLAALARGADLFVCEASFLVEDEARARATGHLTTRAAGEIAAAADVGLLVPFHFSARYTDRLPQAYAEIRAAFPRVWGPDGL